VVNVAHCALLVELCNVMYCQQGACPSRALLMLAYQPLSGSQCNHYMFFLDGIACMPNTGSLYHSWFLNISDNRSLMQPVDLDRDLDRDWQ
jgi:hypothetical protein